MRNVTRRVLSFVVSYNHKTFKNFYPVKIAFKKSKYNSVSIKLILFTLKGLIRTKKLTVSVREYKEALDISSFIGVEVPFESEDLGENSFVGYDENFIKLLNKRCMIRLLIKKCKDNIQGYFQLTLKASVC